MDEPVPTDAKVRHSALPLNETNRTRHLSPRRAALGLTACDKIEILLSRHRVGGDLHQCARAQITRHLEPADEENALPWSVPDFRMLSRRQKTLDVTIPYRGSQGPLHLLIDSTGIKLEGEGSGGTVAAVRPRKPDERNARKHGGPKRRVRHALEPCMDSSRRARAFRVMLA